jgi:hypothetical protein
MTTPDFRTLCAELIDTLDSGITAGRIRMSPLADRARAALAQPAPAPVATDEEVHKVLRAYDRYLGRQHGAAQPPAAQPAPPVAPVSDSKMSAYNHRAADRFAILDRLGKVINFDSYGWQLTSEGERWQQLMTEQGEDEYEMGV